MMIFGTSREWSMNWLAESKSARARRWRLSKRPLRKPSPNKQISHKQSARSSQKRFFDTFGEWLKPSFMRFVFLGLRTSDFGFRPSDFPGFTLHPYLFLTTALI